MSSSAKNHSTFEKQLLAIYWALVKTLIKEHQGNMQHELPITNWFVFTPSLNGNGMYETESNIKNTQLNCMSCWLRIS